MPYQTQAAKVFQRRSFDQRGTYKSQVHVHTDCLGNHSPLTLPFKRRCSAHWTPSMFVNSVGYPFPPYTTLPLPYSHKTYDIIGSGDQSSRWLTTIWPQAPNLHIWPQAPNHKVTNLAIHIWYTCTKPAPIVTTSSRCACPCQKPALTF